MIGPVEVAYFIQPTGSGQQTAWELSGWWRRVGALLIDSVIVMLPIVALFAISVGFAGRDSSGGVGFGVLLFPFAVLSVFLSPVIYYCWIMPSTNGQTVGKRATGIRVVREDGLEMTSGFAFRRQIIWINLVFGFLGGLFAFGIPQLVDYLWPLWDSNNQALHDKMVKSRVVREAPVPLAPSQFPAPPVPPLRPQGPAPFPTAPQPAPDASSSTPSPALAPYPFEQQPYKPPAPPTPPTPPGGTVPYTPPSGFKDPVSDDDQ